MAISFHANLNDVPSVEGLVSDDGWNRMIVQFLLDGKNGGTEGFVLGRARFAPGGSTHARHRHANAEEFCLIVRGHGLVLDVSSEFEVGPGDVTFHPRGSWHGFANNSTSEEVEMIWGWIGGTSKAEAGYELLDSESP